MIGKENFFLGGAKDPAGQSGLTRSESQQVRIDENPVYVPTPVPQEVKGVRFQRLEEVQFCAISPNQLATVIKAYQHASGACFNALNRCFVSHFTL